MRKVKRETGPRFHKPWWMLAKTHTLPREICEVDGTIPALSSTIPDFGRDSVLRQSITGHEKALRDIFEDEPNFFPNPVSDEQRTFLKSFKTCIIKCTQEDSIICLGGYEEKTMRWVGEEYIRLDEPIPITNGFYRCAFLWAATKRHRWCIRSTKPLMTFFGTPGTDRQAVVCQIRVD